MTMIFDKNHGIRSFKLELENIYSLVEGKKDDLAIDVLFNLVDDLLWAKKFDEVNDLIQQVEIDRLSNNLLVGLLSITSTVKDKLSERAFLVDRIETRFKATDSDRVEGLIRGLR